MRDREEYDAQDKGLESDPAELNTPLLHFRQKFIIYAVQF